MAKAQSTLNVPFRWAAKEERKDEVLSTGFFLFQEDEGLVALRSAVEKRETPPESLPPAGSTPSNLVEKTSSVHFLRFELDARMKSRLEAGAALSMGIDHPHYTYTIAQVEQATQRSLLKDLTACAD